MSSRRVLLASLSLTVILATTAVREVSAGHFWGRADGPSGTSSPRITLRPIYDYLMVPRREFVISSYAGKSYPPGGILTPTGYGRRLSHGRVHAWYGK
jgi:hypothetical protein